MKKRQKKTQKRPGSANYYSRLSAHTFEKGRLQPPLNQLEKMRPSSWRDDHMPLMLWAVLLAEVFPREQYLACFRSILTKCSPWFAEDGPLDVSTKSLPAETIGLNVTSVLDMQTIAELSDQLFGEFIEIPLRHPLGYAALRPLLLISSIPNHDRWRGALGVEPQETDWDTLARAIAATLDHQSERSTDIRWFKLMLLIKAGKLRFPLEMRERVEEYFHYPNRGDLRQVRPSIRAGEMMIRRSPTPAWVAVFWDACATKTVCIDPTDFDKERVPTTTLTAKNVLKVRRDVRARFFANQQATKTDARLDSAFGLVLYALSIVEELGASSYHEGILGRLALRTLVEAAVTLNFLAFKDDPAIWASWRVYGAGQAKLAFLKIQELVGDTPSFYEEAELERIANEDQWQEFLDIDVGHWNRTNLRSLAKECSCAELYESYYAWTSSFSHSHWGSVRDTNYITCHNPLHRLHRIPRLFHRMANGVEGDAARLVNGMVDVLERLYPVGEAIHRLVSQPMEDEQEKT